MQCYLWFCIACRLEHEQQNPACQQDEVIGKERNSSLHFVLYICLHASVCLAVCIAIIVDSVDLES